MPELARTITAERVVFLDGPERDGVLRALVDALALAPPELAAKVYDAVHRREEDFTTGIGDHLAIPHALLPELKGFALSLGLHKKGVSFAAVDGKPVHVALLIVGPQNRKDEYQVLLKKVCAFLRDRREALMAAKFTDEVLALLADH